MSTAESTDGWVRACRLATLGEDEAVHVDIGGCPVCLVRTGGAVYALRDECTPSGRAAVGR
jgi:3-phenylpropionate/trans-cinnamate dioxygenase ferredoxin component